MRTLFVQVSSSYEVTPQKSVTVLWLRVQLHVRAIYFTPGAQEYGFDCNSSFSSALQDYGEGQYHLVISESRREKTCLRGIRPGPKTNLTAQPQKMTRALKCLI